MINNKLDRLVLSFMFFLVLFGVLAATDRGVASFFIFSALAATIYVIRFLITGKYTFK